MSQTDQCPQCVVAIDIGSDGCSYAFSADYQFKNDPCDICAPRWSVEVGKYSSVKSPAAILFDSDQTFASFGYDAQDKYCDICAANDQNNWYYIEGFKMSLYDAVEAGEDIRNDFSIKEMNGKAMSAKAIFSATIKHLREHFTKTLDLNGIGVQGDMVHWVISVPAIWTDSCKQFMRESAIQAGIKGDKFSLVYEPEAASIYARLLPVNKVTEKQHIILKTFKPGTKMLVIDAGGGTVDISAQEVLANNGLKIIHKVRGGGYGGKMVNSAFRDMLVRLFSGPCLNEFKKKYPLDYIEMIRYFEERKKAYKIGKDKEFSTRIPATLIEISEESSQCTIQELIANSNYPGKLRVKRDRMFIDSEIFVGYFQNSLQKLKEDVNDVLKHSRCAGISAIMLVGGYAECEFLQNAVKITFPKIDVFVPTEGGLSVLKGAVIYGHTPQIVSSRICNYTYGVSVSKPFNPNIMPQDKSYVHDGELWCRDIFEVSFQIDTVVNVGDIKQIELNDTFKSPEVQERRKDPLRVEICISDEENPQYVSDKGCRRHALILVFPPNGQWPEEVYGYVELEIGGTEMIGSYVNVTTGDRTSIIIEFLPKSDKLTLTKSDRKRVFDPDCIDDTINA